MSKQLRVPTSSSSTPPLSLKELRINLGDTGFIRWMIQKGNQDYVMKQTDFDFFNQEGVYTPYNIHLLYDSMIDRDLIVYIIDKYILSGGSELPPILKKILDEIEDYELRSTILLGTLKACSTMRRGVRENEARYLSVRDNIIWSLFVNYGFTLAIDGTDDDTHNQIAIRHGDDIYTKLVTLSETIQKIRLKKAISKIARMPVDRDIITNLYTYFKNQEE
jgi:hypothetical protein